MPRVSVANATASAPKRSRVFAVLAGLLGVLLLISAVLVWRQHTVCPLRLSNGCLQLDYARTATERSQGLGDRDSLPAHRGMLFLMPNGDPSCFWMKDMRFNLDIVWLDADKRITKLETNLSPGTYPHSYCSAAPAAFVLEVNAGQAAANHWQVGQQLNF